MPGSSIRIIGSTPPSTGRYRSEFLARYDEAVRRMDIAGWNSALIYTSNAAVDPWVLAQRLIEKTRSLRPLVAVQPIYAHPFTVANQISSLATLYRRGVDLNFVAGDHRRDREALNDLTEHDRRYDRLGEFAAIVRDLLRTPRPVSSVGEFYTVRHLQLAERPADDNQPSFLMSGSSNAARAAAQMLGACAIQYPAAPEEVAVAPGGLECGVRLGIIARATDSEAWDIAHDRFPMTEEGVAVRNYSSEISDAHWVKALVSSSDEQQNGTYWLGPFRQFQRACPYLVGSYDNVASALRSYIAAGYRTFLIDSVASDEEAHDITQLFADMDGRATSHYSRGVPSASPS